MTPYFELTPTLGPFEWSWVAGEGETAGVRIDGSGDGIYNLIRPRLPIAANDGISFTVQCRVKSRLNLNGDKQGFTTQVRGFKQNGTTMTQVFSNDVMDDQESWYTRQDPDYVLHTVRVYIRPGTGITHLTIEPMVHAASGFCEITSCRVRVSYDDLIEYRRDSQSQASNPGSYYYERFLTTREVFISANQEVLLDFDGEANDDWQANQYIVVAKFRRKGSGEYDQFRIVVNNFASSNYVPVVGTRTIITEREYDQIELIFAAVVVNIRSGAPPSGVLSLQNIDFKAMTRDVLRNGA